MSGAKQPAKLSSRLMDMKFMRSGSPQLEQDDESKPVQDIDVESSDASITKDSETPVKDPSAWSLRSKLVIAKSEPNPPSANTVSFSDIFQARVPANTGRLKYKHGKRVAIAESAETDDSPDFDTLAEKNAKEQRERAKREKNLKKRKSQDQFGAPQKKARS